MLKGKLSENLTMTCKEEKACSKDFLFVVEKALVESELNSVVKEFSQMVVIPGFRKGKAPAKMLIKRYEKDVSGELQRRIYVAAFDKVTADKSLDIVSYGNPDEVAPLRFDKEYRFSIKFDLAPEFELPEYKGVEVEVPAIKVAKKEIDERIDYYRNMYAGYEDIDGAAKAEDMLKVSYTSDFVLADDASAALTRQVKADDNWLWLNEPELIPGAIKALTGAEKDKEYDFEAEYPADWRDAELAGKKVKYKVKVLNVQRRQALSDAEVVEKLQMESVEKMREMFETVAKNEAEGKRQVEVSEKVYDALDKKIDKFEFPESIMEGEVQRELQRMMQAVKDDKAAEKFKKDMDKNKAEAEKAALLKLRRMFIMRKIASLEDITVGQEEVDAQIKAMSTQYSYPEKELREMMEKSGGMEELRMEIMGHKVAAFLSEKAEIKEKAAKAKSATKAKTSKAKTATEKK